MVVEAVIACRNLEVSLVTARGCLSPRLRQLQATMNGYIPNGMSYQQVYLAGGFPGQRGQGGQSLYYQQGGGGMGLGGAGVVPQLMQLQANPQSLNKLVQQHLGALQQQFAQNYAFTNSTQYHPAVYTPPKLGDKNHRRSSTNELCSDIKQEILRQLSSGGAASTSVTPEASRESSPDQALTPEQDDMTSNVNARGVKRQLDMRQSPLKKRYRSQDDGDEDEPTVQPVIDRWASVTEEITSYFRQRKQPQEVFSRKMRLRDALYTVMKGVFPYCGLYIVGSSMNGLGSASSDMDLCLMLSASEIDQKKEATEILRVLCKSLRACTFIRDLKLIKAKVPILKFYDRISGVECDLNINNSVGIRNTHLLNAYTKLDWRVAPLILFIKHWANVQNINDAKNGTISSYSLVLMILHYLQYGCQPPVIPSLQHKYPNKFNKNIDVRLLSLNEKLPLFKSSNNQSLGELFAGFLNYYANDFNFDTDAISIRLGTRLSRSAVRQHGPPPTQWKCLCIEEPFDLSNTARSVYDEYVFRRIYRVIRVSNGKLRRTCNVQTILEDPL